MSLMGADSIFDFIKARGFSITNKSANTECEITEWEIRTVGRETVIGRYIDEDSPIELYLDYSHDPLHPAGGHVVQLREALGLRLILDHYNVKYMESPSRGESARNLFGTALKLRNIAKRVNPAHDTIGSSIENNPKKYVDEDSPNELLLDYTEISEEPLKELERALDTRDIYNKEGEKYKEIPSREDVDGALRIKSRELYKLVLEVDPTSQLKMN